MLMQIGRGAPLACAGALVALAGVAQGSGVDDIPHAGMLRYPDVSADRIVFVYANDIWTVPKEGGVASPLASPPGSELFPRFSPDGRRIAFQGNYEGNRDLYVMPAGGGVPHRVTHHPGAEVLTDWASEDELLFFMSGLGGLGRQTQLFTVSAEGGMPKRLPVPYGANGSISPDGNWLAYTPHTRDTRTWKRYRGGMATDIWLFNLESHEWKAITDWEGTDTLPMWHGEKVYYLSDAGEGHRLNIWAYDTATEAHEQLTEFTDYDVKFPSIGPGGDGEGEIVFQLGSKLYLLNLGSGEAAPVEVRIPGARPKVRPTMVDAANNTMGAGISATGKRAVIEARGDIWTIPAEQGPMRQITDTSGAAERHPSWSPDGRWIAYFSDESGEYELYVKQSDGRGEPRQVTSGNKTYFYSVEWSPKNDKVILVDKAGQIILVDVQSGEQEVIDKDVWANRPDVDFSSDGRWLTYAKLDERHRSGAIWIYDLENREKHQVTSGFFNDSQPAFSRTGDFLYYASNRHFSGPQYEDVGSTFVYTNTGRIIAVPLNEEVENPFLPESDEEEWDEQTPEDEAADDAEESDEAEDQDADEGDGDEADAERSPIHGKWSGKARGFSQLGLPSDEIEFTMVIADLGDGEFAGTTTTMGQTNDYDTVEFDPDARKFTATRTSGGATTTLEGTLDGDSLSGTWALQPLDVGGEWDAAKTTSEIPDDELPAAARRQAGNGDKKDAHKPVEITVDGFEARGIELPIGPGNFSSLATNDSGHLLYVRRGGPGVPSSIQIFDIKADEPEEKAVLANAGGFAISHDGKKLLVAQNGRYGIINSRPGQKIDKPLQTRPLHKRVNPREEWKQLVTDAWRRHRDFFYVENMHGVDWDAMLERYTAMLEDAASREDVGYIIGEMIAELNVGHAYYWGGDYEQEPSRNVGMLGADFELAEEEGDDGETVRGYRITRIFHGAPWDSDARGPLSQPGVDVEEGDFLIAVNGRRLDPDQDPWAPFVGLAGREAVITVAGSLSGDDEARNERDVVVRTLPSESSLRYRAWVEDNRKYVDEASEGRIGYIYVPNTGIDGQNELFRQFFGQTGKDALLIDERWNGGGQIPTRFIELLNRPRTNYWARRDGKDWAWPYDSHQGPKAMLINGLAGSGGDMFPWLFKQNGLGKLIGTRTWGGLVGITGVPPLIDGGYTAVPTFGFYETDGSWGIEGHGVDPDIEVVDDPSKLASGADPQLDAAIEHLLAEIEANGYSPPERPADPDRSGMGIADTDR